eukprot:TRINITY_DN8473_c0_g1_i1.p1 TRINITY_DN8473_c0_g1~~TRINITY_DN8473_c0_g1_i1.p1  ORF type:complete len:335 (-),score=59.51 TRINITY_DN8473_c0_g1_i1:86-1090(-)
MDETESADKIDVSPDLFTKTPQDLSLECAICLDLLHKPAFSPCGHAFCFWCLNSSMNLFVSTCPLCMSKYAYLPNVCESIHSIVQILFPETYAERDANMKRDHEQHAQSPSVTRTLDPSMSDKEKIRQLLSCCSCHEIAKRPMVMNCGAVVCSNCFKISQRKGPKLKCPRQDCITPLPESTEIQPSAVVKELIRCAFPTVDHESDEGPSGIDIGQEERVGSVDEDPTQPKTEEEKAQDEPHGPIPRPQIHLGVGCDGCGMFPIKGKRYQCLDCPESVGFDLCGRCYDKHKETRGHLAGRFNQNHRLDHRMKLMNPDPELLSYLYTMMLQHQGGQ